MFQRIKGPSFSDICEELDIQDLTSLQQELERTVDRLHKEFGITHGDIKGDNIIMNYTGMKKDTSKHGCWVLVDFGNCQFRVDLDSQWGNAYKRDVMDIGRLFDKARAEIVRSTFIVFVPTPG